MPKSTTKLRALKSPAQWQKLDQEIDKSVRALVEGDQDAKHLAFLIGAVGTEADSIDQDIVIRRILQASFQMTCAYDEKLSEWLDGKEPVIAKQRKRA